MKFTRLLLLTALSFAGVFALMALTQTADAQQGEVPAPVRVIVEIRNADFGDMPLTNTWGNWLSLGDQGQRSQWEVLPAQSGFVAFRNVATDRYLGARGRWSVVAGRTGNSLNERFLWQTEVNRDGETLLRNARTGRYLDADRYRSGWFSIDQNRRAARGTGWSLVLIGNPPTPTATPTMMPTATVIPPTPTVTMVCV